MATAPARYATTQLPDLTVRPDGQFALLHNFSAMGFADIAVTPRLAMYGYYGTELCGTPGCSRMAHGQAGYGSHLLATSGCGTELAPGTTTLGRGQHGCG